MADRKVRLLNQSGDELYPRTTMDNILVAAGSTVYADLVKLNGMGKIDATYLPSYVDDVVELIAMSDTAPATCAKGDLYFNSTSSKIFEATAENTWATTGTDPEKGVIYMDLSTADPTKNPRVKIYRWSGSTMTEIYEQYATVTTVGPQTGTGAATDAEVPTALAVRKAIQNGAYTLPIATEDDAAEAAIGGVMIGDNISIDGTGVISVATAANNGTKGVIAVDETPDNGAALSISGGTVKVTMVAATTDAAGTVELATTTEAGTSSVTDRAVTPAGLASVLADYQAKITTTENITINGGTATVATADDDGTKGVATFAPVSSNGLTVGVNAGTVSISMVAASEGGAGTVALATTAEASSGTVTDKAVTPAGVKAALVNGVFWAELPTA